MLSSAILAVLLRGLGSAVIQDTAPTTIRTAGGARVAVERSSNGRFYATIAVRVPPTVTPADAHLIEHLLTERDGGQMLTNMEELSVSLDSQTSRFQMSFSLSGPNGQEAIVLDTLSKLSSALAVSQDDLNREVNILAEEKALRPSWSSEADTLYDNSWGLGSIFPDTAPEPSEIEAAQQELWSQAGVAISFSGQVSTGEFAKQLATSLSKLPAGSRPKDLDAKGLETESVGVVGIVVGPVGSQSFAAAVGVALALSERLDNTTAVMTEQAHSSLVMVTASRGRIQTVVSQHHEAIAAKARQLSAGWASSEVMDVSAANRVRSSLLLTGRGRLSEFLDAAQLLTDDEIDKAINGFAGSAS